MTVQFTDLYMSHSASMINWLLVLIIILEYFKPVLSQKSILARSHFL